MRKNRSGPRMNKGEAPKDRERTFRPRLKPKTKNQAELIRTIAENSVTLAVGPAGSGKTKVAVAYGIEKLLLGDFKRLVVTRPVVESGPSMGYLPGPQPLDVKLATPEGWKFMGEINVGDFVIGRDGIPTKVLGVYPKGFKKTFEITTSDGTSTKCCSDHLWYTQTEQERKKQGKVRFTKDISQDIKNGVRHFIPRNEPVHFNKKELSVPPYTLGVLLGDGSSEKSHVRFASADQEIVDRVNEEVSSLGLYCKKAKKQYSKACVFTLSSIDGFWENSRAVKITNVKSGECLFFASNTKAESFTNCCKKTLRTRIFYGATVDVYKYEKYGNVWNNPILKFFVESDLKGKKAWEKFIPDEYKYSSIEDRLDILRGLMDTDGSCRERKGDQVSFSTTSPRLADDVSELVRSLGGKAKIRVRDRIKQTENNKIKARRLIYEISISMPPDLNPFYLPRKSSRFIGKNVHSLEIVSVEEIGVEEVQCIMVENPEHLYLTDDFIVTHNTFAEKIDPYLQPVYYELLQYLSKSQLQEFINNGISYRGSQEIIIAPLAYMRGMNYHDSYMILDEAQNCTQEQIKLFITRVGFNSKVVIVGDDRQSDLPAGRSGLLFWHERLQGIQDVGTFRLENIDIVRNPVISRILSKMGE
jgi:phosphate starvation-inducible protein PhoH